MVRGNSTGLAEGFASEGAARKAHLAVDKKCAAIDHIACTHHNWVLERGHCEHVHHVRLGVVLQRSDEVVRDRQQHGRLLCGGFWCRHIAFDSAGSVEFREPGPSNPHTHGEHVKLRREPSR